MIYFEDLQVGAETMFGTYEVTREEVLEFARKYDPQPFHLSDEEAAKTHFGRLAASGWHTCALAMRLTVDNMLRHSSSLGSPGLDSLKWLKPVYPGDVLSLRHTILESRGMRKRPEIGLVRSRWEMFNQHGDQVLLMEGFGMFHRRQPAGEEELAQMDAQRAGT